MFIPGKMILNVLILKKYLIFVHADFTLSGRNKPLSDKITAYETNYIFLPVYGKV